MLLFIFSLLISVGKAAGKSFVEYASDFRSRNNEKKKICYILGNNAPCKYEFSNPVYPAFTLPPAQPNSPGDVWLNVGNPIRRANNHPLKQACNSGKFYYQKSDGTYSSIYTDSNGSPSSIQNQFYVTNYDRLYIRTIQQNNANLGENLGIFKTRGISITITL